MAAAQLAVERADIAVACHQLATSGLVIGSAGNISVRAGDRVAITASGARLADITVEQVIVVDLDGSVVDGELVPTSELQLHLDIYRHHPQTGAVVHTHAPKSTAVACVLDELPVLHYQQLLLGGATKVAPFHPFGSRELADAVSTALAGRNAALMANHGAVTHGPTLTQAVEHTLLLEWACAVYLDARALGTPRILSADQQSAVIDSAIRLHYGRPRSLSEEP
ncbi:class II aldolase/adducin family protein [Mycolicibacterium sp. 120266]|uniref:class II aldolase/adducin family protein n=1 Tax=Mycolicibacterium sp. 120266 TaxID=3090601 RepID=UPI00299E66DE|nr:class II aldolase/adducin family protein [Mycolicibacterium sp. 120266]MDX1873014.1 class II aldolase/adducin family protein [Mycolicibacterium sp. 120266]